MIAVIVVAPLAAVVAFALGMRVGAVRHARALAEATQELQEQAAALADESFAVLRQAIRDQVLEEIARGEDDDGPQYMQ